MPGPSQHRLPFACQHRQAGLDRDSDDHETEENGDTSFSKSSKGEKEEVEREQNEESSEGEEEEQENEQSSESDVAASHTQSDSNKNALVNLVLNLQKEVAMFKMLLRCNPLTSYLLQICTS